MLEKVLIFKKYFAEEKRLSLHFTALFLKSKGFQNALQDRSASIEL